MSTPEIYTFTNGWTMDREPGESGRWIVRDASGREVDRQAFLIDVLALHGLEIAAYAGGEK